MKKFKSQQDNVICDMVDEMQDLDEKLEHRYVDRSFADIEDMANNLKTDGFVYYFIGPSGTGKQPHFKCSAETLVNQWVAFTVE